MTEAPITAVPLPDDMHTVDQMWDSVSAGPKAQAMRYVYEEQQKLVTETQRLIMEKSAEYAIAVLRAKAAQDMGQEELKNQIVETEIVTKRQEIEDMERKRVQDQALLDAFMKIGKGII